MKLFQFLNKRRENRFGEERYILALDGGGMRGLVTATILQNLEKTLFALGDKRPFYSHFDLIAGTSTGGLIALALTAPTSSTSFLMQQKIEPSDTSFQRNRPGFDDIYPGVDLRSIVELYMRWGKVIFPRNTSLLQLNIIGQLFNEKYDDESFVSLLEKVFGSLTLDDALVPTMVVTYDCKNDQSYIISSFETPEVPMKLAARATSAAPTYFSPTLYHDLKSGETMTLVDGGVVANNPSLYAYIEAKRLYPEAKRFHILSISSAGVPFTVDFDGRGSGVIGWLDPSKGAPIYRLYASSQMHTADTVAAGLPDVNYLRVHTPLEEAVKLDEVDPQVLTTLIEKGHSIFQEYETELEQLCRTLSKRPALAARRPLASTALATALGE